ncbi:MAG TPA: c-type cytochrome [Pseudolabrys sp.]|jgi:cytochrome c oxidase cbb3-type subunit 3|nr:c-type cytochrome [Pseudolabrys sp.]
MSNNYLFARRALPLAFLTLLACGGFSFAQTTGLPPLGLPPEGETANVPIGGLAGGAQSDLGSTIKNPAGTEGAHRGRMLYVKLNCADCHGYDGKGGMGPDLTDKKWIFGGTPAEIFKSIFQGRPEGMPSWGKALPKKDIWQLVAYIQSLGGSYPPQAEQASRQGDKPGELVAPELDFEQALDGSPPYPAHPFPNPSASQSNSGQKKQ